MIIRPATPGDAAAMAAILNEIIAIGGTTAHQSPKTPEDMRVDRIDGPDILSGVVAEEDGMLLGFQSVELWDGDAHIGTFVKHGIQAKGIGAALFAETRRVLRGRGVKSLLAYIRADNAPGLAYYARIGFYDIGGNPDFALNDGRVVGQIYRRFDLV
jgi:L-amino acid N-acyltransferase YncA